MAPANRPHKPDGKKDPRKPANTKATFTRLLGYLGRSKAMLAIVFVFVAFSSLAAIIGTMFIKTVTDEVLPEIISNGGTDLSPLIRTLVTLGLVYGFGVISSYCYSRIMLQVAQKTLNVIRKDLFDHMQELPIKFFDTHTHGELMSRYTSDTDTLRECISQSFVQLVTSVISVVGTFAMMVYLSPVLALFVLLMLCFGFIAIKMLGSRSAKNFREQQKCVGKVNGYIEEFIEGLKVVKVFCHEQKAKDDFGSINENLRKASTNAHTYASVLMPVMGNISYITYAAIAMLGTIMLMMIPETSFFAVSLGEMLAFLTYTRSFFQPITQISQQFNTIIMALDGA